MRRLMAGALVCGAVAMAGCTGGNPTAPAPTSAVQFRLDQNSCGAVFGTRTLTFNFFLDGNAIGSDVLGIGVTSSAYQSTPGAHVASASVTNSTVRWQNLNVTLAPNQTFTYILLC